MICGIRRFRPDPVFFCSIGLGFDGKIFLEVPGCAKILRESPDGVVDIVLIRGT